ncbi:transmembrane protein 212-like [Chanos chanos]|uniref:Transmembrane protein 212-like n=1 Tax=Chanos chanos TaxID=29144 RepID=A0A6J2VFH8_CHACN|nr:transmembrane protein 212 [Chanos chanos]
MVGRFDCIGFGQLSSGLVSVISGILAFFPVGSNKLWYINWGTKFSAPIWTGVLWEVSYIFSVLCTVASPVQFTIAVLSILLGPYCYYTFSGAVGTGYLAYAVSYPYPYLSFPGLCLEPRHYEWYHLSLQTLDLVTSLVTFVLSLIIIILLTQRMLRSGLVNGSRQRGS